MRINRIGFGYTKNFGNYENCKIWLEADLEDWEDPSESLNILRDRVLEELELPETLRNLRGNIARQKAFLADLKSDIKSKKAELAKAEQAWENFEEFLTAHGVDPITLTVENFAETRADHSFAEAKEMVGYTADDSAELAVGELDTSDDYDHDDDDYYHDDGDDTATRFGRS